MTSSLEDQLRMELNRVASSTEIPVLPADVGSRRSTRSGGHRVAAAIAAGTVLAVGVPVAAAAGGLDSIGNAFGWSHGTPLAANDSQATQLLQLTVNGKDLRILRAPNAGGGCVSVVDANAPATAPPVAASCSLVAPTTLSEFESSTGDDGSDVLIAAPGAAAILVVSPTDTRTIPVAQGVTYVRLSAAELNVPVKITSLAADHSKLQQITAIESNNPGGVPGPLPTGSPINP
jgi:phosphoribosylcarboxyaminoimidazole (NCAIR) mutase